MADSFRSINVDIWDEDVLVESDLIPPYHVDPTSAASEADKKSTEARGCINRSDPSGALQLLLHQAVYGGSDFDQAKDITLTTLLQILNSVKAADIPSILKSLDLDQRDGLMKWIYKGLSRPELGSSGILLAWHEKLTEIAGTGCIVRVMTDRRRI